MGRVVRAQERDPITELGVVRIGRQKRARRVVVAGDDVLLHLVPVDAQHPLGIVRGRDAARVAIEMAHVLEQIG